MLTPQTERRLAHKMKRILAICAAAALLLAAGGCQKQADTAYEMPTDVERLYATVAQMEPENTAVDYELPDGSYVWDTTSDDGCLTIHADAEVIVPDTALFMAHASNGGFTQEQVTGIFNYLFAGRTVTASVGQNVQTKDEIQTQLERMYQALKDGSYADYGFTKEEYEEAVAQYEQAYETAPETDSAEPVETDGTLYTVSDGEYGDYQELRAQADTLDTLVVSSYPADNRMQLASSCNYERYEAPAYSMLDAVSFQAGDALPQDAQGKLSRTYDDAKSLSDGLLAAAGADVSLLASYVVGDRQAGDTDGVVSDAKHFAYEFVYTRTVGGVAVATDAWAYEQIKVIVDDEGVALFHWSTPVTVDNDAADCATLLTFEQAREIFEKTAPITYGAQTVSANPKLERIEIDASITRAELCLLYVKDQNTESKTGLLVPAWVFYGDIISQSFWNDGTSYSPNHRQGMSGASGCGFYPGPSIVFAVNAADGSVIDTALGY
jgi:hypothetical protein